ncbi:LAMI_0H03334g1_1 [Lachancea mirantina]|uniref:Vacuolar ATPase assembly protein VMA22 n=1 Tax=Lachancea mirantina TaxID=1230905 RepID=A0A1G4KE91_9SACH|nr:LAMI_0H03334g1_1 [Lachancea mirantina]
MTEKNDTLLKLLDLLANYDTLLEQLQTSFSEGFYQLSRANYHNKDSIRGRFGMDYWDNTFEGTQLISVSESAFNVVPFESRDDDLIENDISDDDFKTEKDLVRRRKLRKQRQYEDGVNEGKRQIPRSHSKDPIHMFGGVLSVPTSLRQSQSSFKGSLAVIIELTNCRKQICRALEDWETRGTRDN